MPLWMVAGGSPQLPPAETIHAADPALVARVLRESGADTSIPAVGWVGWVAAVWEALERWLAGVLGRIVGSSGIPLWISGAAILGVLVALLIAAILVVRAVVSRRKATPPTPGHDEQPALPVPAPARDATAWRAVLETKLGDGDIVGALEAVWWWVATSLAASAVNPAWTSRELAISAQRADLLSPLRALDAWTYGPALPDAAELGTLVARLEKDLA